MKCKRQSNWRKSLAAYYLGVLWHVKEILINSLNKKLQEWASGITHAEKEATISQNLADATLGNLNYLKDVCVYYSTETVHKLKLPQLLFYVTHK